MIQRPAHAPPTDEELQTARTIRLRKISSMDGSALYSSLAEKNDRLKCLRPEVAIPTYPPSAPYRNNLAKRFYARARYFGAVVKQRLSGTDYPVIAIIVVNNKCNWNCTYCFGDYPSRKETDYTTDELKYLVESLHGMGVRYLNLHGGETLLRPDIGDICNFVKNLGMYLCVITNGSLLEKKIDEVRNVDNLTISLDGAVAGNEKNRGAGTFDITIKAIDLALSEGLPLRVSATLTKHTMNDVGFLANLAREKGFHLYFSILFKPLKKAKDAQMTCDEIRTTLLEIQKYKDSGYPIFTSQKALRAAYEWPYDFNDVHHVPEEKIPASYRQHHVECHYSRTKFTIEADGYIYPCFLTTDGSFAPKNWKVVGVAEAIAHVQKKNVCRACPALSQNDHNLLLGLKPSQVAYIIKDQIGELFRPHKGAK